LVLKMAEQKEATVVAWKAVQKVGTV